MVAVQFLLDGGGEAEELADDYCRQDKDGGGYGEGGRDEPEAGDLMDGWSWDGEQDSDVVDAVVGGEDAGVVGEEGFEEGCDEEADAGEVSDEGEEEDDEAGEAFGGDSEGGAEEQHGGEAVAGGSNEGAVAVVGRELLRGA